MSLDSVRADLARRAPDLRVVETEASSASVAEAAAAHGVPPERIAKTLAVRVGDRVVLVVAPGTARLDNRKVKDRLGGKPAMLGPEETLQLTGHPVGGVCPFGLPTPLPVYLDLGLRRHGEVIPAAGSANSALRIAPERLAELTDGTWADLCREPEPAGS